MANAIALFKKYIDLLDEVYKKSALTSVLDSSEVLARAGANANEIIIPKISMDGLGDYSRNSGYVGGDVTLTNQTVAYNYDRGRKFTVDAMDDEESMGMAFGRLAGEFIRVKVVPEGDAFRFAEYASVTGIGSATADITTGAQILTALRVATVAMDESEVPPEDRHLFITSALHGLIMDLDSTFNSASEFASITKVPQTRFYTAITMLDGSTGGEEVGGYSKGASAKNINFAIIHKPAIMQYNKHIVSGVIAPEQNPDSDGYLFKYRKYGLADAYENKVSGIYVHKAST